MPWMRFSVTASVRHSPARSAEQSRTETKATSPTYLVDSDVELEQAECTACGNDTFDVVEIGRHFET